MKVQQTGKTNRIPLRSGAPRRNVSWIRALENLLIGGILCWAAFILSASAIPASEARLRTFAMTAAGLGFDLVDWEVESLRAKLRTAVTRPGARLEEEEAAQLVREYMARAWEVGNLEREVLGLESLPALTDPQRFELHTLQLELEALRQLQSEMRPVVEDILECQVSWALRDAGLGVAWSVLPPVKFRFTEPPRKVIVSPRDRIATTYTSMVRAGLPISTLERIEAEIAQQPNAVGYVSNIGGLGAYPAMVVDRANLRWVISTIAHEWAHNYLTFFPLGLLYFASGDLTTMNETIADIVGEEIALIVLRRFYPDLVPPEPVEVILPEELLAEDETDAELDSSAEDDTSGADDDASFDFRVEMRATRLEVDRLLEEGKVEEAEAYMDQRRMLFVENGYSIRVLNQAYFAFHGSYASSPASVSPIGPKMDALRAATPDLPAFLHTVRWFTTQDDLDAALASRVGG